MKNALLALITVGALLLTACSASVEGPSVTVLRGSGQVITESRNVSGFNALVFAGLGEITITQGPNESLTIEAEENIVSQIKTTVSGGALRIGFDREKWQEWIVPTKPVKFTLVVKDLTSIESSGLGNISVAAFKTNKLTLKLSGVGNLKITNLDTSSVTTTVAGAGNVDLAGKVTGQTVTLSGLGNYNTGDLSSDKAQITVSGAGNATVWARESLDVTIKGAGSVNYYGSPTIKKTISGFGVFNGLGEK